MCDNYSAILCREAMSHELYMFEWEYIDRQRALHTVCHCARTDTTVTQHGNLPPFCCRVLNPRCNTTSAHIKYKQTLHSQVHAHGN